MNAHEHKYQAENIVHSTPLSLLLLFTLLPGPLTAVAGTADSFQYRSLFNPGQGQLAMEEHGRIMIYDGMDEADVERAMDEQFERIEHMMFVRTRHHSADGEVEADDDGC